MVRLARYALVLALALGTLVPPGARACPIATAFASPVAAGPADCGSGCDEACPESRDEGCTDCDDDCDDGCATCPCCAVPAGAVPLRPAFAVPSPAAERLLADRFVSRGGLHAAGPFQPPRA